MYSWKEAGLMFIYSTILDATSRNLGLYTKDESMTLRVFKQEGYDYILILKCNAGNTIKKGFVRRY